MLTMSYSIASTLFNWKLVLYIRNNLDVLHSVECECDSTSRSEFAMLAFPNNKIKSFTSLVNLLIQIILTITLFSI